MATLFLSGGKLMAAAQFLERLFGNLPDFFKTDRIKSRLLQLINGVFSGFQKYLYNKTSSKPGTNL